MLFLLSRISSVRWWAPLLILLFLAGEAQGQSRRRHSKRRKRPARAAVARPPAAPAARSDFYKLQPPKLKYVKPDTTVVTRVEEMPGDSSDATQSVYFNPAKELNIINEDTATLDLGLEDQQIVEMSEEVLVDSSWIKVAGYYAIWDSKRINPYRTDASQLRDTVHLNLIDPPNDRLAEMPLSKTLSTSSFGPRWGRWHFGQDIDCETGDSVVAPFDGVVRIQQWDGRGYGNYIVLRHYNGLETLFGHLSKALVKVGEFVKAGQLIGWAGSTGRSTGSHLHYELRYEGNPFDPNVVYDFNGHRLSREDLDVSAGLFNYYRRALHYARPGQVVNGRMVAYHKVRQGDILGKISRKYHVPIAQICRLNGITPTTMLRLGRNLRIR